MCLEDSLLTFGVVLLTITAMANHFYSLFKLVCPWQCTRGVVETITLCFARRKRLWWAAVGISVFFWYEWSDALPIADSVFCRIMTYIVEPLVHVRRLDLYHWLPHKTSIVCRSNFGHLRAMNVILYLSEKAFWTDLSSPYLCLQFFGTICHLPFYDIFIEMEFTRIWLLSVVFPWRWDRIWCKSSGNDESLTHLSNYPRFDCSHGNFFLNSLCHFDILRLLMKIWR